MHDENSSFAISAAREAEITSVTQRLVTLEQKRGGLRSDFRHWAMFTGLDLLASSPPLARRTNDLWPRVPPVLRDSHGK
jgi:hypothetical protein